MHVPDSTFEELEGVSQAFMDDTLTVWETVEDTSTEDPYDTTQNELYGPIVAPHEGIASVTEDMTELAREASGDATLDADAAVRIPMIGGDLEKSLIDKDCEATFRGQTRTGMVVGTRRRRVTVLVLVEWG